MKVSDRDHPFFRPLWRRIAITGLVALWAAYEFLVAQEGLWMALSVGFLVYAVYIFFLTWTDKAAPDDTKS
jgi:hypothetical protein